MEKTNLKQAGITLVALIVTVIVMLILAGVTLNFLLGENGLLNKSETAYKTHVAGKEKEAIQMALADLEIAKVNKEIEEITAYILEKHLKEDGYSVSVVLDEGIFLITFLESHNIYVVDQIGNVEPSERYNINYNLNGGNNPPEQPQTYQRGETVGLLYPTKEGEAFEGWYETSDFSGERITEIRNRREDITVYAKWVEETEQDYFKWSTDGTTITGLNGNTRTEIVIPKTHTLDDGTVVDVTTIGASAFSGHSEIIDLKLQKILILEQYSFNNCTGLESIEIPKSIEVIKGSGAPFTGCTNLKNVIFEEGTEIIPASIFSRCPGPLEIYLPKSITTIGKGAFYSSGLTKIEMSDGLRVVANGKICESAFNNCKNLKEIKISHAITEIESYVFLDCTGLESIEIPKSITTIKGSGAPFTGCTNLKNVTFEEGTEIIPASIFSRCPGPMEIYLPESITTIGKGAFYSSGLTKIEMSDGLRVVANGKICESAFNNCKNLKEIKISHAITEIESYVFLDCTGLESIEIPKSITTIKGSGAPFTGCTNLKNVTFEEGTEIIPASIFSRCPGPMEIYLPESITTIGKGAFYASGITNITISNNLKTIKYGAFSSCSSLSVVNYRGNENEWRLISIESGNDAIKNIIPTYNYED